MFSFRLNPDPTYPPLQEAGTESCSQIATHLGEYSMQKRLEKGGSLGGGNVREFRREQKQNGMVGTTLASGSTGSDGLDTFTYRDRSRMGWLGPPWPVGLLVLII